MSRKKKSVSVEGPQLPETQSFKMIRNSDETGVSGTGTVLDGIVFPNGVCCVQWRGATPCVTIWPSFDAFKQVHIDAHPTNDTEIKWLVH